MSTRPTTAPLQTTALAEVDDATAAALTTAATARGYAWSRSAVRLACLVEPAAPGRWWRPRRPQAASDAARTVVAVDDRHLGWVQFMGAHVVAAHVVRFDVTSVRDTSVLPRNPRAADRRAPAGGIALHGDLGPVLGRTHTVPVGDNQTALTFRETVLLLAGQVIES